MYDNLLREKKIHNFKKRQIWYLYGFFAVLSVFLLIGTGVSSAVSGSMFINAIEEYDTDLDQNYGINLEDFDENINDIVGNLSFENENMKNFFENLTYNLDSISKNSSVAYNFDKLIDKNETNDFKGAKKIDSRDEIPTWTVDEDAPSAILLLLTSLLTQESTTRDVTGHTGEKFRLLFETIAEYVSYNEKLPIVDVTSGHPNFEIKEKWIEWLSFLYNHISNSDDLTLIVKSYLLFLTDVVSRTITIVGDNYQQNHRLIPGDIIISYFIPYSDSNAPVEDWNPSFLNVTFPNAAGGSNTFTIMKIKGYGVSFSLLPVIALDLMNVETSNVNHPIIFKIGGSYKNNDGNVVSIWNSEEDSKPINIKNINIIAILNVLQFNAVCFVMDLASTASNIFNYATTTLVNILGVAVSSFTFVFSLFYFLGNYEEMSDGERILSGIGVVYSAACLGVTIAAAAGLISAGILCSATGVLIVIGIVLIVVGVIANLIWGEQEKQRQKAENEEKYSQARNDVRRILSKLSTSLLNLLYWLKTATIFPDGDWSHQMIFFNNMKFVASNFKNNGFGRIKYNADAWYKNFDYLNGRIIELFDLSTDGIGDIVDVIEEIANPVWDDADPDQFVEPDGCWLWGLKTQQLTAVYNPDQSYYNQTLNATKIEKNNDESWFFKSHFIDYVENDALYRWLSDLQARKTTDGSDENTLPSYFRNYIPIEQYFENPSDSNPDKVEVVFNDSEIGEAIESGNYYHFNSPGYADVDIGGSENSNDNNEPSVINNLEQDSGTRWIEPNDGELYQYKYYAPYPDGWPSMANAENQLENWFNDISDEFEEVTGIFDEIDDISAQIRSNLIDEFLNNSEIPKIVDTLSPIILNSEGDVKLRGKIVKRTNNDNDNNLVRNVFIFGDEMYHSRASDYRDIYRTGLSIQGYHYCIIDGSNLVGNDYHYRVAVTSAESIDEARNQNTIISQGKDVLVYEKPVANFEWMPFTPTEGDPIVFDASNSQGSSLTYHWNIANIVKAEGKNYRLYQGLFEGTHQITLKVTDDREITDTLVREITVNPSPISLNEAIDNFDYVFQNGWNAPKTFSDIGKWMGIYDDSSFTYDGDCLKTSAMGHIPFISRDGKEVNTATLYTYVDGPVRVSFKWRVSSMVSDTLTFWAAGQNKARISGWLENYLAVKLGMDPWKTVEVDIWEKGHYKLSWMFRTTPLVKQMADEDKCFGGAWIDHIEITPLPDISLKDSLETNIASWSWGCNGNSPGDIRPPQNWKGQGEEFCDSYPGHDEFCAESGDIPDNGKTWIEATITGSGILSFWWKTSCEKRVVSSKGDYLKFYIDDELIAQKNGKTEWELFSYHIPDKGTHTLKWCYEKDRSYPIPGIIYPNLPRWKDRVWVDHVIWEQNVVSPLQEGVDNEDFVFITRGHACWEKDTNQYYNDGDSIHSGIVNHNEWSIVETTIQRPGWVSFWWKVDSDPGGIIRPGDKLMFEVNGDKKFEIQGKDQPWSKVVYPVDGEGSFTLTWWYLKDYKDPFGLVCDDRGWVDDIRIYNTTEGPITELSEGVDSSKLTFVSRGHDEWFKVTDYYYQDGDSIRCGDFDEYPTQNKKKNKWSAVETKINGPGWISFYWAVNSNPGGALTGDKLKFEVDGQEPEYTIEGVVPWTQVIYTIDDPGEHTLTWWYDKDAISIGDRQYSDCGWIDKVEVYCDPPFAQFKYKPDKPNVEEIITFDASDSYDVDGGDIVNYAWDFDNDGSYEKHGKTTTHSFDRWDFGWNTIKLKVTDDEGLDDTIEKQIYVLPVIAKFHYLTRGNGNNVTFDASYSESNGDIISYEWDWNNDGYFDETRSTPLAEYYWPESGGYKVALRVTDEYGETDIYVNSTFVGDVKFFEDFNDRSSFFPVNDWSTYQTGSENSDGWIGKDEGNSQGSMILGDNCAFHDIDESDSREIYEDWLVSPKITITPQGATIQFSEKNKWMNLCQGHKILISVSDPNPNRGAYTEIADFTDHSGDWTTRHIDLNQYSNQDIYIAFEYIGSKTSEWYIDDITLIDGNPPAIPEVPIGKTEVGVEPAQIFYKYTTNTIDTDNDQLYYQFDWDDASILEWIGPYDSGENIDSLHHWNEPGSYNVKVKAKDKSGLETDWSPPLTVKVGTVLLYEDFEGTWPPSGWNIQGESQGWENSQASRTWINPNAVDFTDLKHFWSKYESDFLPLAHSGDNCAGIWGNTGEIDQEILYENFDNWDYDSDGTWAPIGWEIWQNSDDTFQEMPSWWTDIGETSDWYNPEDEDEDSQTWQYDVVSGFVGYDPTPGHGGSETGSMNQDEWLMVQLDLTGYSNVKLEHLAFLPGGADIDLSPNQHNWVKISDDYSGVGNPNSANWEILKDYAHEDSPGYEMWYDTVLTVEIPESYEGKNNVWVAFHRWCYPPWEDYISIWVIDNVRIIADADDLYQNEWLITPTIDCSEYEEVYLSFYGIWNWIFDDPEHNKILISSNNGASWNEVVDLLNNDTYAVNNHNEFIGAGGPGGEGWFWNEQKLKLDISEYAVGESTVKIAWQASNSDMSTLSSMFMLDDIVVSAKPYTSPQVITLDATNVNGTSASLNGELVDLEGANTAGVGFVFDTSSCPYYGTDWELGDVMNSLPTPGTRPNGLTWDGENLWCADGDSWEERIYQIDINGNILGSFDLSEGSPYGLTWDGENLWCGVWSYDLTRFRICKISTEGEILDGFSYLGSKPSGLAWDAEYLWIADYENEKIYKYTIDGDVLGSLDMSGHAPFGLTWDGDYLWCTDPDQDKIYKIDASGNILTSFDSPASDSRGLTYTDRYLCCADADERIIYVISLGRAETGYLYSTSIQTKNSPDTINEALTDLAPDTTYYYRTTAHSYGGSEIADTEMSFSTPQINPKVITDEASYITINSVQFNGFLEMVGAQQSDIWFVWDTQPHDTYDDYSYNSSHQTKSLPGSLNLTISDLVSGETYHYRAVSSNDVGVSQGDSKEFSIRDKLSLEEALDNVELIWSTGGNTGWFGQNDYSFVNSDAAESGTINDNEESWMQTTIQGPCVFSFDWKVSSEENGDFLRLYIDRLQKEEISGSVDWEHKIYVLNYGSHTVNWSYQKEYTTREGNDCGWVDNIIIVNNPPNIPAIPYYPPDGAADVSVVPILGCNVSDPDGHQMNVSFYWEDGTEISTIHRISNDSTALILICSDTILEYNTCYKWYVTVDDGGYITESNRWNFTTGCWDPWIYDIYLLGGNSNGIIDYVEVINAIKDYFDLEVNYTQVIDVLKLYFRAYSISNLNDLDAIRTMPDNVLPSSVFNVNVETSDYGIFAQVIETLPTDFIYVGSTLDPDNVELEGNKVKFTLFGETTFDYTVESSSIIDTYTFYGILKDQHLNTHNVTGDTEVTVVDECNSYPDKPTNPNPSNNSINITIATDMSCIVRDPDGDTMTVFFYWNNGALISAGINVENDTTATINPDILDYSTTYYWYAIANDTLLETQSDTWSFTTEERPASDLYCTGSLSWTYVQPGETVTGDLIVKNIGDLGSLLDWKIESYPEWGIWTFTPSSGNNLTPEDDMVKVEVSVVAPNEQNQEFTGEIRIANKENTNDFCLISVCLATPKNKNFIETQISYLKKIGMLSIIENKIFITSNFFYDLLIEA